MPTMNSSSGHSLKKLSSSSSSLSSSSRQRGQSGIGNRTDITQAEVNDHLRHRLHILERANELCGNEMTILKKENSANKMTIKTQRTQIRSLEGNVKSLTATYKNLLQTVENMKHGMELQKQSLAMMHRENRDHHATHHGESHQHELLNSFDESNAEENSLDHDIFS